MAVVEAKELTIKSWSPWMQEEEPVRDQYGNYKGSVTFEEYAAQPVDVTFKTEPNPGDKKYGEVVEYQTKAGKTRLKFKRVERPQEPQQRPGGYQKSQEDKDSIYRCNALNNAVAYAAAQANKPEVDRILSMADKFYGWLKNEQPQQDNFSMPSDEEMNITEDDLPNFGD